MKNVLIIGGGLAGCTAARELSESGIPSVLLESSSMLGGKVREYGCKTDTKCSQCGVCLTGNLWEKVEHDPNISKYLESQILDLYKGKDGFTVLFTSGKVTHELNVSDVIVASGFTDYAEHSRGAAEMSASHRIITGRNLEVLLKNRTTNSLFESHQIRKSNTSLLPKC
jgi:heterodisulfide reductase subunit A-like polyferredoxin